MHRNKEDIAIPNLRYSLPASAASADLTATATATQQSPSWIRALATIGAIASAPFILRQVASVGDPSVGAETESAVESPRPDWASIRTVLVREAELGTRGTYVRLLD